ncbi:MAG: dipeptidase [Bryobacteraceae bacterium]|nr:dipeptidase [Bryobacteraceae bacterium]
MSLRTIGLLTFAVAALLLPASAQKKTWTDAEVMKIHRSALLIDTHNDVTSRTVDGFDFGPRAKDGHTDIARMKEGGQGGIFFAVYVDAGSVEGNHSAHRTLQMIDTVRHDIVERYPNDVAFAGSVAGILAARKHGKIAALMGIEGGHAIEDDVRLLRDYYALGVRYMTLTHVNNNTWATSSGDKPRPEGQPQGLTDLGRQVVHEMNRLGMLVDISHVSDATFWDVLKTSEAPPFASHSSCRAISNIPRNMTDEMIQALAKKGGVVQINFGCEFLSQKSADSSPMGNPATMAKLQEELKGIKDPIERHAAMEKMMDDMGTKVVRATIDDVVAHIDHIKQIAGVDAVGLGSDFDGVSCTPAGLDDVSKWPNLTRKLLEKGYSEAEIRKIYSGNLLRVMGEAEKTSARLRAAK